MMGAYRVAVAAALLAALAGCDLMVTPTPSEAPGDVQASDGTGNPTATEATAVVITWDAAERAGATVTSYEILRAPAGESPFVTLATVKGDVRRYEDFSSGVAYDYRIRANFSDGSLRESTTDTGYALTYTDIQVSSALETISLPYGSKGGSEYFRFLGQAGWTYEVNATGVASTVSLLSAVDLAEPPTVATTKGGDGAYRLESSGMHFIRVIGGSGEVTVTHF